MPQPLTYPGVYIEEVPSGVRTIAGVATSIGLFIGWATRGRVNEGERIFSFADFEREYGGLDRRSYLGYAVRNFFDNGGYRCLRHSHREDQRAGGRHDQRHRRHRHAPSSTTWLSKPPRLATGRMRTACGCASAPRRTTKRFKLEVLLGEPADNVVVETFENLSKDAGDPRFVEAIVNARSSIITVKVPASPRIRPMARRRSAIPRVRRVTPATFSIRTRSPPRPSCRRCSTPAAAPTRSTCSTWCACPASPTAPPSANSRRAARRSAPS